MSLDIKKAISSLTLLDLAEAVRITPEIVQAQYRKYSKLYHPDTSPDMFKDGRKFNQLSDAKEFLIQNLDGVNDYLQGGGETSRDSRSENTTSSELDLVLQKVAAINERAKYVISPLSDPVKDAQSFFESIRSCNRDIIILVDNSELQDKLRMNIGSVGRSLAIFTNNERHIPALALQIINDLLKDFSDLPDLAAKLYQDRDALNQNFSSQSKKSSTVSGSFPSSNPSRSSKKEPFLPGILAICILVFGILGMVYAAFSDKATASVALETVPPTSKHTVAPIRAEKPLPLPKTGQIFTQTALARDSKLSIDCTRLSYSTAGQPHSVYVKLKNATGKTEFSFFVRGGEQIDMPVPSGLYYVYFAEGSDWYGINSEKCFGEYTYTSKDDLVKDFYSYTYSYTLYPVEDGNFIETPVSYDEFEG